MNKVSLSNLIGCQYPFFLSNTQLSSAYYLYQVCSPKLNKDLDPYISMSKISEKTVRPEAANGHDSDIISACLGSRRVGSEKSVEYLNELLKKENLVIEAGAKKGDFPLIVLKDGNTSKSMIIALRHNNRWKNYRFFGGRYVDVLWTPNEYVVFKIVEDETHFWIEPVAAYKNSDVEMQNPLNIDLSTLEYDKTKWLKSQYSKSVAEALRSIKIAEWGSFSRNNFTETNKD